MNISKNGLIKKLFILLLLISAAAFIFLNIKENRIQQHIRNCSCYRDYFYRSNKINSKKLNSSCSDEGTFYELNQKVISMSFYLKQPVILWHYHIYLKGLIENVQMMKKLYPGHSLRLYTDIKLEDELCKVVCDNPELFWCDIRSTPSLGDQHEMIPRTWRFLPLGDPTVEYFLSRDLDSVISKREVAVVNKWLNTTKPIHLMRDHADHNGAMLAGLWGARNDLLGNRSERLRAKMIDLARNGKNTGRYQTKQGDQDILKEVIYYPMLSDILAFDSYHCGKFRETAVAPFLTRRENTGTDFVGNWNLSRAVYDLVKCPIECRPDYGKDWEYC